MHHDVDAAADLFTHGLERKIDPGHERHRLDAHERVTRAVRMRRRERAAMAGVHRLEHVERFAATDLSDYDSVRSHPQRGAQQRPHVDRAGPLNAGRTCLQGDDVRLRKSKLRSVLDGHDPLVLTDRERERVQGGGLSTRGPARDEHASPVADGLCEEVDALTAHGRRPTAPGCGSGGS